MNIEELIEACLQNINFRDEAVKNLFLSQLKPQLNEFLMTEWKQFERKILDTQDRIPSQGLVYQYGEDELEQEPILPDQESVLETVEVTASVMEQELIVKDDVNTSENSQADESEEILSKMEDPLVEHIPENNISENNISENINSVVATSDPVAETVIPKVEPMSTPKKINTALLEKANYVIANAKVGEAYAFRLNLEQFLPNEFFDVEVKGLENFGLTFDINTFLIQGVPTQAGEYNIILILKDIQGNIFWKKNLKMFVNPDPKSLWKDIPTDPSISYYKKDEDSNFIRVKQAYPELKNVIAASQRGRSHAHEGKPRDDDFSLYFDEETQWYVLATADGAGSAKYSRKGSEIAAKKSVEFCLKNLHDNQNILEQYITEYSNNREQAVGNDLGRKLYEILVKSAHASFVEINNLATQTKVLTKDFATTLILSICKKFDFGWFVATFWIGDGGVGVFDKEQSYLKILGDPDGGEFAGQTRFITMPEMWADQIGLFRRIRFDIIPDFTSLILMTDGVTDPKFETDANLNQIEKWNNLWEDLSANVIDDDIKESSTKLLNWLDYWSPGNHDDRTIVILY